MCLRDSYLSQLLRILMSKVDAEGREHLDGGGRFLDWPWLLYTSIR